MRLPNWMRLSREPDEVIGQHEMLRWFLLPRNRWFNVYLHKHQGDDPRTLHDHPCDNVSIRLCGQLIEYSTNQAADDLSDFRRQFRRVTSPDGRESITFVKSTGQPIEVGGRLRRINFRPAEAAHRLELVGDRPCWTLWIRFRNRRQWGYFEPTGWRPAVTARQPAA